jgi:formimidoylglutamate deiminase
MSRHNYMTGADQIDAGEAFAFAWALTSDGWARDVRLTVRDGRITTLETGVQPRPGGSQGFAAIPGVPNLHSHAFQRAMAGQTERRGTGDADFWTWRETMYAFAERLTPEHMLAVAAQAFAEMLEAGFTRVGEFHYLHHAPGGLADTNPAVMAEAVIAAAEETGIALTLLPVFYAHAGFGGAPLSPRQARFGCDGDRYARLHEASAKALTPLPDGVIGLAPHSLRAVTPEELEGLLSLYPAGPVHIHIAEQIGEVEASLAWSGQRPVRWLLDHAPVDERWCLVHATHLDEGEIADLAASGAVAGLCPITEANLGDGVFPAGPFLAAGGRFGVGSDSNVRIDAGEELRLLEYSQRLTRRARNLMAAPGGSTGARLLAGALVGGAQALGAPPPGLAVGAPADFLELDPEHPALAGLAPDFLIDAWIFSAGREAVRRVWRRGRLVVSEGRHVARDRIARRYRAALAELMDGL